MTSPRACPQCGAEGASGPECPACGVIFSRFRPRPTPAAASGDDLPPEHEPLVPVPLDRSDLVRLGGALGVALLLKMVPCLGQLLVYLVVLFHEFGHAAAGWIFGYPSIPAFDFVYGGGWTIHNDPSLVLRMLVGAGIAAAAWKLRAHRPWLWFCAVFGASWLVILVTRWDETAVSFMGHGTEVLLSAVFLYRGLSGTHAAGFPHEKPLYAAVGAFGFVQIFSFCLPLMAGGPALAEYLEGKAEVMNDLEKVAWDIHIRTGLQPGVPGIAFILLVCAILAVPAVFAAHRYRPHLRRSFLGD